MVEMLQTTKLYIDTDVWVYIDEQALLLMQKLYNFSEKKTQNIKLK